MQRQKAQSTGNLLQNLSRIEGHGSHLELLRPHAPVIRLENNFATLRAADFFFQKADPLRLKKLKVIWTLRSPRHSTELVKTIPVANRQILLPGCLSASLRLQVGCSLQQNFVCRFGIFRVVLITGSAGRLEEMIDPAYPLNGIP